MAFGFPSRKQTNKGLGSTGKLVRAVEAVASRLPGYEGSTFQQEVRLVTNAVASAAKVEIYSQLIEVPLCLIGVGEVLEFVTPAVALGLGVWSYVKGKKQLNQEMLAAGQEMLATRGSYGAPYGAQQVLPPPPPPSGPYTPQPQVLPPPPPRGNSHH